MRAGVRKQETYYSPRTHDSEVDHGIALLGKPTQFCLLLDSKPTCNGSADVESDALPDEGPEDYVVGNEGEIEVAFLVAGIFVRGCRYPVRDEDKGCQGIGYVLRNIGSSDFPVGPEYEDDEQHLQ